VITLLSLSSIIIDHQHRVSSSVFFIYLRVVGQFGRFSEDFFGQLVGVDEVRRAMMNFTEDNMTGQITLV